MHTQTEIGGTRGPPRGPERAEDSRQAEESNWKTGISSTSTSSANCLRDVQYSCRFGAAADTNCSFRVVIAPEAPGPGLRAPALSPRRGGRSDTPRPQGPAHQYSQRGDPSASRRARDVRQHSTGGVCARSQGRGTKCTPRIARACVRGPAGHAGPARSDTRHAGATRGRPAPSPSGSCRIASAPARKNARWALSREHGDEWARET
jgi:hypothetical protein